MQGCMVHKLRGTCGTYTEALQVGSVNASSLISLHCRCLAKRSQWHCYSILLVAQPHWLQLSLTQHLALHTTLAAAAAVAAAS
jgi:hypothetical protein